jgi:hypothetical protein
MGHTKVTNEDLSKIRQAVEEVKFGSVKIVVQDGKVIQIEKLEKVRLNS